MSYVKVPRKKINICNFFFNKTSDYLLKNYPSFFNNQFLTFFLSKEKNVWDNKTKIKIL